LALGKGGETKDKGGGKTAPVQYICRGGEDAREWMDRDAPPLFCSHVRERAAAELSLSVSD
jgi:hypothetical protein